MTFYAYVYVDPRDGKPFYVGKGQGRRARKHLVQTSNRGMAARLDELRAVGLAPEISTYACIHEAHALELERVLIEAYGRLVDGSGCLVNILEAGERSGGMAGRKHRPESIEKIRTAMRARVMTPEHKEKIRAKARLRTLPANAHTLAAEARKRPEVRARMSETARRTLTPEHHARMIMAAKATFAARRAMKAAQ